MTAELLVFTARHVCITRTMPWHDVSVVHPSVRLSSVRLVTRRYSEDTAEPILKMFSPSDSHTIPVYPKQTGLQYSDGDHLTGHRMQGA